MLKVSYMRYHKPKKELCDSIEEFERWVKLYELQLSKRKKPLGDNVNDIERYEKRKQINRESCKKYYYKKRGLKDGTN